MKLSSLDPNSVVEDRGDFARSCSTEPIGVSAANASSDSTEDSRGESPTIVQIKDMISKVRLATKKSHENPFRVIGFAFRSYRKLIEMEQLLASKGRNISIKA